MVICGDFNYPKISWDAPDTSRGVNEQAFVEALHDHYLTQIQRKPTRGSSGLDLQPWSKRLGTLEEIRHKDALC